MHAVSIRYRGIAVAVVLVAVALVAAGVAFAGNLVFGSVQRVNVASDGGLANGEGLLGLACSADGRYVAFASSASNILEGDTNGRYDIFVRDVISEETTLVNVTMSGGFGTQGALNYVEMTPDGRYVLFTSFDSDVVPGDTNGYPDVFVRDMVSNETTCVSTAADGTFGDYYPSGDGSLSDDGRYAVFSSSASNLFPGDTNWKQDCIVKDLQSGETTNVSYTYDGGLGNAHSFYPVLSGDGTKVAFISYSTGMVPGDVSSLGNLFFRDLLTGELERVDETTTGGESANEVDLIYCDVDYTGRHVVFGSRQKDIVSVPTGVASQVYLRDTVSDETTVVARTIDGNVADNQNNAPRISSDGRWVSFAGQATNLVVDDTNNVADIFLRDMQSDSMERLSLSVHGGQLDRWTYDQALGANATAVAFNTSATNIFDTYTDPALGHIYVRVFRGDDPGSPSDVQLSLAAPTTSAFASAKVSGYLRDGESTGLSGKPVQIQYYSGGWKTAATVTTNADGNFERAMAPKAKTKYRAYFAGDAAYLEKTSAEKTVLPMVRLTRKTSWSSLTRNKAYYAKGYIEPYHSTRNSNKVKIRAYKKGSDGDYHYVKSFTASYIYYSKSKTAYKAKVVLTSKGSWMLKAYHATDSTNYKTYGSKDYVTVK